MRLLATMHALEATGSCRSLCALLIHLRHLGWEVDLRLTNTQRWDAELADAGVQRVHVVDPARYDVALANGLFAGPQVPDLSRALPVVFWVHEGPVTIGNLASRRVFEWFGSATSIVFQTRWQAEQVFASFLIDVPRHRMHFIPAGVDPDLRPSAEVLRRPRHIVFVGSVYPRKRPGDLIHAVAGLADLGASCDFIGSMDDFHRVPESTRRLAEVLGDRVRFLGELRHPQVIEHMAAARVLCLPSMDETLPIVIPEAALAGAPSALTDLPGYRDKWVHGINCLLSPVGAVDVLGWNLRAMMCDDALHARLLATAKATARGMRRDRMLAAVQSVIESAACERYKA